MGVLFENKRNQYVQTKPVLNGGIDCHTAGIAKVSTKVQIQSRMLGSNQHHSSMANYILDTSIHHSDFAIALMLVSVSSESS